jgi:hypothetical protein
MIKRGSVVPERYSDLSTSGLSDTVDKNHSGNNLIKPTD